MNCRSYQESLLKLDLPNQAPAELQVHLGSCEQCRELQRRLVLLQDSIKQLPLPVALSRLEFLQRFLSADASDLANGTLTEPAREAGAMHLPAPTIPDPARLKRPPWIWYTGMALAATMGFAVVAIKLLYRPQIVPPAAEITGLNSTGLNPMIQHLVDCNRRLAHGATVQTQVEALADMADDLFVEAQRHARSQPGEVKTMATLFEKVVKDGVLKSAARLPPQGRRTILTPIIDRLSRTAQEAETVAVKSDSKAAASLRRLSDVARQGGDDLRQLAGE
jgi:hypothetical protein